MCSPTSCVAYNPYHKHRLVSSDYEGSVCLWDTSTGQRTGLHQVNGCRGLSPFPNDYLVNRSTAGESGLSPTARKNRLSLPPAVMTAQ